MTTPAPFFERPSRPEQQACRVLLLSYHFPPSVAVGARRWEQFAQFIADRGWGLDVVMYRAAAEPSDAAAMAALPEGVRVFAAPQPTVAAERLEGALWRTYRWIKPRRVASAGAAGADHASARRVSIERTEMRWPPRTARDLVRLGAAWMICERERAWAGAAAALARRIVVPGVHRAIISSGPPHMAHEGARAVSVATGLPLVVDMRDPWSLLPMLHESIASEWWYRVAARLERRVIARASVIICNTDPARSGLAQRYPAAAARMITVLNGTDNYPLPAPRRSERFAIRFAGTVYLEQDVRHLLLGAARVIREESLTTAQVGLDFIGEFGGPGELSIEALAREAGIADYVTVGGRRPHAAALDFLSGATMLVVFVGFGRVFIPAKTFEYMRFEAWLLTLAEPGSATEQLLRDTDADVVAPADVPGIAAAIRRRYDAYRNGAQPTRVARDDRFSRARQAEILLDAVERVFPQPAPRRDRSALAIES